MDQEEWRPFIEAIGGTCAVERLEFAWAFRFQRPDQPAAILTVTAPWRIFHDRDFVLSSEDHGQTFGLAAPTDAQAQANALLAGRQAGGFSANIRTADIQVFFAGELRLEVVNTSTGYEAWTLTLPETSGGFTAVATAGRLSIV